MGELKSLHKQLLSQKGYVRWLAKYTVPYLPRIALIVVIGFISTSFTISLAVISKRIIDDATIGGINIDDVWLYVALIFATLIANALTTLVTVFLDEHFSFGIRKQLFERILHSDWMKIIDYHTGDLMTRMTSDARNISDGITNVLPTTLNMLIQLVITFIVLYYYEPLIAVMALIFAPIAAIISFLLGRVVKRLEIKVQESEAAYRSYLQESMGNLLVIKAFTNESFAADKLVELRENRFKWVKKRSYIGVISSSVISVTFHLGYIAAFSFGAYQISRGEITYGTLTVFLTLVNRIQGPIIQLARNIPKIARVLASAGRVIELQEIDLEERSNNTKSNPKHVGVSLEELSFGYNEKESIFSSASTMIKPQEFVAIIGESGIGKTTMIRLILSFLNPDYGNISFWDGDNRLEILGSDARQFISYVPQGNTLFSGTIRANLSIGKNDATDADIWEALEMAAAVEFVNDLPHGLDTLIGEKGHGISEGQAQRIAIARAFIKKAPFLILDEATSALDEDTELNVLKGLKRLEPRPTCLIVTHRSSILEYCDRELKISDSCITEVAL